MSLNRLPVEDACWQRWQGGFGEFLTVLFGNKQLTREATVVRHINISMKSESHPS